MSLVTPQYLLEGAFHALEQGGLLLRDANLLYESGSYANSKVIAAFATEELGRSAILQGLRARALAGEQITLDQVKASCGNHVAKQRAGMLSTVLKGSNESGLGKMLQSLSGDPQSVEWKEANAKIEQLVEQKRATLPAERHAERMSALYVEPKSDGWGTPAADVSPQSAYDFLQDAINDYSLRYQRFTDNAISARTDPDLHEALKQWNDRPTLWAPEWPHSQLRMAAQSAILRLA